MKKFTTEIITGFLFLVILILLIIRLRSIPGGMILSSTTIGIMLIGLIFLVSLILAFIIGIFLKSISFLTTFFIITSLGSGYFYYNLYSPTLVITVPVNYSGEIDLVLANIDENILEIDSNGIGYINQKTFNKVYLKPTVKDKNGTNLDSLLIGFNQSSFWGVAKHCCIEKEQTFSKKFKIKETKQTFKIRNLTKLVNRQLTKTMKPDKYTIIHTNENEENVDN